MAKPHLHEMLAALPSPWLLAWAHLIKPGGTVLDVACGSGRHVRWLHAQGFRVSGVDHNAEALVPLRELDESGDFVAADIEQGPWPFLGRQFDTVLVTNYLWRPLWPTLLAALAPGGLYLHETFAHGQANLGRPRNPEFLLQEGELLQACSGLQVVAYENGFLEDPPRFVQRIAAVRAGRTAAESATPAQQRLRGTARAA